MSRTLIHTLVFSGFLFAGGLNVLPGTNIPDAHAADKLAGEKSTASRPTGVASDFLISHYAQSRYDWDMASSYIGKVLKHDPENPELLKRAMIMAMGAGDLPSAVEYGKKLHKLDADNTLADLIMAVDALANGQDQEAIAAMDSMPPGEITDFVGPLLRGWAQAGQGKLDIEKLNKSSIHAYNGALMALYMKDTDRALILLRGMTDAGGVSPYDAERAGDLMVMAGLKKEALSLYQGILDHDVGSKKLEKKAAALKDDKDIDHLIPAMQIKTPAQGAAVSMFDMARILFDERSDSSVKLFANMALALDPSMQEARMLMANVLARNGRYDEALRFLATVQPGDDSYIDVQHYMADLLVEAGRTDEALSRLNKLFTEQNDVDALIRIGDIYRGRQDFGGALQAYNDAAAKIGDKIPEEYWYLLYARGMAYEREGEWNHAESDFKAALAYRPDHPYLMNYLAYGWADQGIHLDESLALLERASSLRPDDGYISDSLGWVLYRMGRYDEALPELERAVELLPYDATLNDHLGDVYWKSGRKLEARFQWERAVNVADDEGMKAKVRTKLASGLVITPVREAKTDIKTDPASSPTTIP